MKKYFYAINTMVSLSNTAIQKAPDLRNIIYKEATTNMPLIIDEAYNGQTIECKKWLKDLLKRRSNRT